MKNTSRISGLTLIELLVVISIIGLLASTVLASLSGARGEARDTARLSEAKELMKALELYRNQNGNLYPCSGPTAGVTLSCASNLTGGAVEARIIRGTGNTTYSAMELLLRPGLNFSPSLDSLADPSLFYITRNTGVSNQADRSSYTIVVGSETDSTYTSVLPFLTLKYCKITTGTPDTNTILGTATNVSTITDCPIKGLQ